MNGPIRFAFFDVGATLIQPYPSMGAIYARVLEPLGIEAPTRDFLRAFSITWDEMTEEVGLGRDRFHAFPGGENSYWSRYVERVLERVNEITEADPRSLAGRSASECTREATVALHSAFSDPNAWQVFPEVRGVLAELRRRGVRLGVISNWDSRLPMLLERLNLASFFETVVYSSAAGGCGHEKPSPVIFKTALDRAGASAAGSIHVGDDLRADVEGAQAAGLSAVLIDRKTPLDSECVAPGSGRISSLVELLDLIPR